MCGGRLVHVPCAHIGHVHRTEKPYTFPGGGQEKTEMRNYLRAAVVWLGPKYTRFFVESYPGKICQANTQYRVVRKFVGNGKEKK